MTEYWLISAPGERTCQETWEKLNSVTSKQNSLSDNFKFHIPDLKVGTLDQLVGLSDDLGKLDVFVEGVTRKSATYLGEVLENQRDSLVEHLLANGADLAIYIMKFQWDMAKYPIKQSLRNIAEIISKQVSQIDADLKAKSSAYNNLKGNLKSLERKSTGSLLARNLGDLVKKQHFVNGSEYLTTLLVVVPRLIYEDQDHGLFTVTLFQKVVDEFKLHARENKFIVREFVYNEEELLAGKNEIAKLEHDKKKQFSLLVRWLKVNFSETFTAWIHVKALRVFVESVLRYGLPVNFQAMLLRPHKKSAKRLREVLNQLYSHLDTSIAQGPVDDIPGLNLGQGEYYPYVFFKININMVEGTGVRL
ncbi:V-type proton ATPase subunit Vha44 isoform X2 [Tachypleus tridentatus]|uniref:V-type proton ATPase subunit Vha44 isoform X2 n=1 Tax=Tachypleus tridentatus TaxID=6853 RepID=UPI003FD457F7